MKYRRKALDNEMLTRKETILKELMKKWEGKLIEFNGESDHIHANISVYSSNATKQANQ